MQCTTTRKLKQDENEEEWRIKAEGIGYSIWFGIAYITKRDIKLKISQKAGNYCVAQKLTLA